LSASLSHKSFLGTIELLKNRIKTKFAIKMIFLTAIFMHVMPHDRFVVWLCGKPIFNWYQLRFTSSETVYAWQIGNQIVCMNYADSKNLMSLLAAASQITNFQTHFTSRPRGGGTAFDVVTVRRGCCLFT
jgi:hypothetical protein